MEVVESTSVVALIAFAGGRTVVYGLLLAVIEGVGLTLFGGAERAAGLIVAVVLVLFGVRVLVKHFAGTVHRVWDAVNLLLILSS